MMLQDEILVKARCWLARHGGQVLAPPAQRDALLQLETALEKIGSEAQAEKAVLSWRKFPFEFLVKSQEKNDQGIFSSKGFIRRRVDVFRKWKKAHSLLIQGWIDELCLPTPFERYGTIVRIEPVDSESHDGGALVRVVVLEDGRRMIFKPKPSDTDDFLSYFMGLVESVGLAPFRIPSAIRVSTGLIQEYVKADGTLPDPICVGQMTAILYYIRGTDFHSDNMIINSNTIFITDTETIFSPGGRALDYFTPFDTGVLPSPVVDGKGDSMDYSMIAKITKSAWGAESISLVLDGFLMAIIKLIHSKEVLMPAVLNYLGKRNVKVRVVLRSTMGYFYAIKKMPVEKHEKSRRRALAKQIIGEACSAFPEMLEFEIDSIGSYEIPSFRVDVEDGRIFYRGFEVGKTSSPIDQWIGHCKEITPKSARHLDCWLREWLNSTYSKEEDVMRGATVAPSLVSLDYRLNKKIIKSLYGGVARIARSEMDMGSYYASFPISKNHSRLLRNNVGLYNGWSGFALFANQYGRIFDDYSAINLARDIAYDCSEIAMQSKMMDMAMGLSGILLVYTHIVDGLDGICQMRKIDKILNYESIFDLYKSSGDDFLNGRSGALFALGKASKISGVGCGEIDGKIKNLALAMLMDAGRYQEFPLGFAHGSSGWLVALAKLNEIGVFNNLKEEFNKGIRRLIDYQDGFFNSGKGWPDLRMGRSRGSASHLENWCSGAAGIGMARHAALQNISLSEDELIRFKDPIEKARQLVINSSDSSLDLCCGEAGKIDFLLFSGMDENANENNECAGRTRALLGKLIGAGIESNFPRGGNIGFFKGYSGLGYALCRAISNGNTPAWME